MSICVRVYGVCTCIVQSVYYMLYCLHTVYILFLYQLCMKQIYYANSVWSKYDPSLTVPRPPPFFLTLLPPFVLFFMHTTPLIECLHSMCSDFLELVCTKTVPWENPRITHGFSLCTLQESAYFLSVQFWCITSQVPFVERERKS